jgi:hypothetical protein
VPAWGRLRRRIVGAQELKTSPGNTVTFHLKTKPLDDASWSHFQFFSLNNHYPVFCKKFFKIFFIVLVPMYTMKNDTGIFSFS